MASLRTIVISLSSLSSRPRIRLTSPPTMTHVKMLGLTTFHTIGKTLLRVGQTRSETNHPTFDTCTYLTILEYFTDWVDNKIGA